MVVAGRHVAMGERGERPGMRDRIGQRSQAFGEAARNTGTDGREPARDVRLSGAQACSRPGDRRELAWRQRIPQPIELGVTVECRGVEAAGGIGQGDDRLAGRFFVARDERLIQRPPLAQVLDDEHLCPRIAGEESRTERWRGAGAGQKLQAGPVVEATIGLGLEVLDDDRGRQAGRPSGDAAAPDVIASPRLQQLWLDQASATERAPGGRQNLLAQGRRTTRLAFSSWRGNERRGTARTSRRRPRSALKLRRRASGTLASSTSTSTRTSSSSPSRKTSTWDSPLAWKRRTMPSMAEGNTFTPRTISMSSSRPRIPPSRRMKVRPHGHGAFATRTRSPVR